MELLSPVFFSDDRRERLRFATDKLGIRVGKLYGWVSDKGRQLRSIAGNDALIRTLISTEKAPAEGARLRTGQQLNIYRPDGTRLRLQIFGVRSGGFSNAYSVIDLDGVKPYCLKENRALPGDEQAKNHKLSIEAAILLRLGAHPNLVTTFAAFHHRGRFYLLTEFLPDESLDLQLKRGPIGPGEAVIFGAQICRALSYARDVLPGFVHGDVKPGNCMLTRDGGLKLGDFGMAAADGLGRFESGLAADLDGVVTEATSRGWGGTASYMAPEMFDSVSPDRSRADVYALGVTLFEMLSSERPFTHASKNGLIELHRSTEPPWEKLDALGLPRSLVELVRRCLSKSPAERPADLREIERELLRIADQCFGAGLPATERETEIGPDPKAVAMSLAEIGSFTPAVALLDAAIASPGPAAELLAAKATILAMAGRVDEAYGSSTAALMLRADLLSVLLAHGRVLAARGDHDLAVEYLRRALLLGPNNCTVLNLLGDTFCQLGELELAKKHFDLSIAIDAEQTAALIGLAQLALAAGDHDNAIAFSRKAREVDAENASAYLILAEALSRKGSTIDSIKAYKDAMARNADPRRSRRGFVAECRAFRTASGKPFDRGFVRLLVRSACVLKRPILDRKTADRFVNAFIAAIDSERDAELAFFHDVTLAKIADGPGVTNAERLVALLDSVTRPPNSSHLQYSFGRIFYHLNELDKCEAVFKEILATNGPNESSYYFLGACAEIKDDPAAALAFYKKANALLDCEDSRTGIRRMMYELERGTKQREIY